jgi:hypothetical protein
VLPAVLLVTLHPRRRELQQQPMQLQQHNLYSRRGGSLRTVKVLLLRLRDFAALQLHGGMQALWNKLCCWPGVMKSARWIFFWRVEWRRLRCSAGRHWGHAPLLLAAQALARLPSDRAILIVRMIPQEKVDGAVTLISSIPW